LAKEVEAVNQYAAVIDAPTANGTSVGLVCAHPHMTAMSPNVAMNSLNICAEPLLAWVETE
jgi:hypothetical protein